MCCSCCREGEKEIGCPNMGKNVTNKVTNAAKILGEKLRTLKKKYGILGGKASSIIIIYYYQ